MALCKLLQVSSIKQVDFQYGVGTWASFGLFGISYLQNRAKEHLQILWKNGNLQLQLFTILNCEYSTISPRVVS